MDIFWIFNPNIILENYYEIIPTKKMSRITQLNTISRFLIYLTLLVLLFDSGNGTLFTICLTLLSIIILLYFIDKSDVVGEKQELVSENIDEINHYKKFDVMSKNMNDVSKRYNNIYNNTPINTSVEKLYSDTNDSVNNNNSNNEVESGYIDMDGTYRIGNEYSALSPPKYNSDIPISFEKYNIYKKATERKPTIDNPFANIVFTDYLDAGNLVEPVNVDDAQIRVDMQNLYNSSIYRNTSDVFERENSQRLFYSVPINTIPNKQSDFANWLYKTGPTCKENTVNCTYYEIPNMTSPRY